MQSSLKQRLILLFVLFTCIPVIIGGIVNAYISFGSTRETTINANANLNHELSNGVKRTLDAAMGLNDAIAEMPMIRDMQIDMIKSALADIQKKNPQLELIALIDKNGNQIARSSGKNGNRSDREYFKKAITGTTFLSAAYVSATSNNLCVTVSSPIYDEGGDIVGVIASDVTLSHLWDMAEEAHLGKGGYIDIVDNNGIVLAHPDKTKITNKENFNNYDYVKAVLSGQIGAVDAVSTLGSDSIITYEPVGGYNWAVITYEPTDEVYASVYQNLIVIVGIVVLFCLLSVLVSYRIANGIARPLQNLVDAAGKIARGDLSTNVEEKGLLEIRSLAIEFNSMTKNLRALIRKTTETAETVSAASEELAASIEAVGAIANNVTSTVGNVVDKTKSKMKISDESVVIINDMVSNIETSALSAEKAAGVSKESRTIADEGYKQSDVAIKQILGVQQDVNASAKAIGELGEKSRQIGQIIDTISGIAGQTNLLALNAAIEAARAGEHGRGFAVVAEEVSKLAEQSEMAAGEIAKIIGEVRKETMQAVEEMDKDCKAVEDGVVSVQKAGESFNAIQQAVQNMSEQIDNVLSMSTKQKANSAQVESTVHELAAFLKENAEDVQGLADVSENQLVSVREVKAAAADLAKMAMELRAEISKFSV